MTMEFLIFNLTYNHPKNVHDEIQDEMSQKYLRAAVYISYKWFQKLRADKD
jgi:hypothetical protein